MSNVQEISIVKLMDGSTIVGKVVIGPESIEIEHPIELVTAVQPLKEMLGEQISLRPWMAIAEDTTFVIERFNVITIGALDIDFQGGYERMVNAIYFEENNWTGGLYKADTGQLDMLPEDDELDIETLTELAEAVIKKQIH